ncbi:AaceriADR319Wp [[Ashbya] aceris (nom. inval.)]|nr:AaceriADR319Wp [[Ashbya] aceris (nom. inval.)]
MGHTDSDSDYSSSDESINYVRPLFLHKRATDASNETEQVGTQGAIESPGLGRPTFTTKRFDFSNTQQVRFKEPAAVPCASQPQSGDPVTANLRAYGDVNGYQFLIPEEAYERISRTSEREPNVAPSIQIPNAPRPGRPSGHRRAMREYWFGDRDLRIPVPTLPPLVDASRECVTADRVRAFLTESSSLLQIPFQQLLKQQRIRWHPDRMQRLCSSRGIVPRDESLITLVSQIINELWRENQSSQM